MSRNSLSAEYDEIVAIAQSLHHEWLSEHSEWNGSPFEWIKLCPGRAQNVIGEKIVSSWLALHDFNIERSPDPDADRIIEGKRVVIRFSTQWKDGTYLFQQIRENHFDMVILFGVTPDDAHCWVIPQKDIVRLMQSNHTFRSCADMHSPLSVRLNPENIETEEGLFLSKYGNGLHDALSSISLMTGYTPKDLSEPFES